MAVKILLVGGGTGGSVSPLLAVAEAIKQQEPKAKFLMVGTHNGPESHMAAAAKLEFTGISAGKLRRYFSWKNFYTPFLVINGFFQARKILKNFKPDCVFGAGSFVQVPVAWAAKFLKIPVVLHQQDFYPSLANTLCQAAASKITVTFEKSLTDFNTGVGLFYKKNLSKIFVTGNPFRSELEEPNKTQSLNILKLNNNLPVLLVLGGSTGAESLNKLVIAALPQLVKFFQVIHVSGNKKTLGTKTENYLPMEFTTLMGECYAAADIVLSRCGLSTITELSNLKKVSVLVPMPDSHQELNGALLQNLGAAIVLPQKSLDPESLTKILKRLLFNYELQKDLTENIGKIMPKNSSQKIAKIILETINVRRKKTK